jgi:hypothetical protein
MARQEQSPARTLMVGVMLGITLAAAVALFVTVWEWVENPGGIFRDASGTNWAFIYDTAVSWFVPVALWASPVLASVRCGLWYLARRREAP